jgi:lipopolysaccharide export system protein LptA
MYIKASSLNRSKQPVLNFSKRIFIAILLLWSHQTLAQIADTTKSDTSRVIQIIKARSMRQITTDSSTILQTLAGGAVVMQGNTLLSGDSIVLDPKTGIAEVFGNVDINDGDTLHTYAQYLRYVGNERMAYLKNNVRLTDSKGTLYTDELEYNIQTGIATYKNGGRVVNGSTVLTSTDATYYSDTKDVYFKKDVHLVDPKYDIRADSLLYNTQLQTATFISPTHIVSKDGSIIDTKSGTYNLNTGEAIFYDRTAYRDSTHSIVGNSIAYDEKSGIVQVEGNGKLVDSANKVIVIGDQILLNKKNETFLATRKPVMIFYRDNDSTYVAADTLFSGKKKYDSTSRTVTTVTDTLNNSRQVNTATADSIRYFLGFHHVRIYNDSLQAVSDSLYYSTEDSVFRLYYDPVCWSNNSQVSGDTMYMYTRNQKADRLSVFYNSFVINRTREGLFNQMAGRTLNAYFTDGNIDYIRVKGSPAESIFYPQDDDSAYIGMNRSNGDVIDIYFVKKELNKVKFVNNVNGTLYPIEQIPTDLKFLNNFKWMDNKRPKSKLELFE